MSAAAAIGEARLVDGFALAGVEVRAAETEAAVRAAFEELGPDVALLVLTTEAAAALELELSKREDLVWVSLPA